MRRFQVVNLSRSLGLTCAVGYVPSGNEAQPCVLASSTSAPVAPPLPPMENNGRVAPAPSSVPVVNTAPASPPPQAPVVPPEVLPEPEGRKIRWVNSQEGSLGTTLAATGVVAALAAAAVLLFK